MRASRQWRDLKYRKWHGFGHRPPGEKPASGELSLFCAACPQPGINLPATWKDDVNEHLYQRGYVVDGNFTAVHQKQRRPEDDVWLTNGTGFMTGQPDYLHHLSIAKEHKHVFPFQLFMPHNNY